MADASTTSAFSAGRSPRGEVAYMTTAGTDIGPRRRRFEWTRATRELEARSAKHLKHPRQLFVATVPRLTSDPDNTEDGHGRYREPVDEKTRRSTSARGVRGHRQPVLLKCCITRLDRGAIVGSPRYALGGSASSIGWRAQAARGPRIFPAAIPARRKQGVRAVNETDGFQRAIPLATARTCCTFYEPVEGRRRCSPTT